MRSKNPKINSRNLVLNKETKLLPHFCFGSFGEKNWSVFIRKSSKLWHFPLRPSRLQCQGHEEIQMLLFMATLCGKHCTPCSNVAEGQKLNIAWWNNVF